MFEVIKKIVTRSGAISLLLAGLCVCTLVGAEAESREIPQIQAKEGNVLLSHWVAIGPFQGGTDVELLDQNLVGAQADLANEAADAIKYAEAPGKRWPSVQRVEAEVLDFKKLYDQSYERNVAPTAAYMVCKVANDQARSAYLMLGSHDAIKVWLNGKVVYEQRLPRRIDIYSDAIKISLPAGENVFCLKTVRSRQGWSVAARLAGDTEAASVAALEGHGMLASRLLAKCMVGSGEPLAFAPFGIPADVKLVCTVRNFTKTWEKKSELVGNKTNFPESETLVTGLYWAEVMVGGHFYSQPFLVGPPASLATEIMRQADALELDEAGRLNCEALKRRINFLLQPENLRQDRTLVHALTELSAVVNAVKAKQEPFKAVPGLHVRAFKSKIDDLTQYYRIFVPSSHKAGTRLPLVVVMPTTISSKKPFIESAFLSAHGEAERMSVLAEKYGLAVLWCGYRKIMQADPAEYAHIDEVIDVVGKDYALDADRITLAGSCSGGVLATGLVAREPGKYAAIALHNAVFSLRKTTTAALVRTCYANASFRQWALSDDSIDAFMDRSSTPTLLVHDGAEAGHGDLRNSEKFAEIGKHRGKPVTMERVPQTVAQHFFAWDRMLGWLSQARRVANQAAGAPSPKTINEVFTQRFTVIAASGGTAEDQQAVAKLSARFAADWRTSMFGEGRTSDEKHFAAGTAGKDENLVLIGNQSTSTLWAELAPKAGVALEQDKVRIGERVWIGKDLSLQVRVDNPKAPGRSVVFVGGSDLSKVNPGTMNLAMDGWYQYAIWDAQGKLVDAGML
jgi:pimeloyl-ACP methyl ester carboxylesterase